MGDGDRVRVWLVAAAAAIAGVVLAGGALSRGAAPGLPVGTPGPKIIFARTFASGTRFYVMNADGSGSHRVAVPARPAFSRDGRKAVWGVVGERATRLYVADAALRRRRQIARLPPNGWCLEPAWSPNGRTILYTLDCDVDFMAIGVAHTDGSGARMLTGSWNMSPAWSPDGRTIVFTSTPDKRDPRWRLYLMDAQGRSRKMIPRSTPDPSPNSRPAWSPDGRKIYYLSGDKLRVIGRNGRGGRDLTSTLTHVRDFDLSPSGRRLAFAAVGVPDRGWEIYVADADGTRLRQLTENRTYDTEPQWSPNGRRIVYTHGRTTPGEGNPEIHVMNADGSGQTNVSRNPSIEGAPDWLPPGATP